MEEDGISTRRLEEEDTVSMFADGEEEDGGWDDWDAEDGESEPDCVCLFCNLRFSSSEQLFGHCSSDHSFDFRSIRKELGLDFYGSFKLINYVRSQVAENKCWSCGVVFGCQKHLLGHLHASLNLKKDGKFVWEDDVYLKPFMQDDALLHCFDNESEEFSTPVYQDELEGLINGIDISDCADIANISKFASFEDCLIDEYERMKDVAVSKDPSTTNLHEENMTGTKKNLGETHNMLKDKQLRISFANVAARDLKVINENYFGAYGSYGIHREMISDKVRMDAYRGAILNNPSLMNQATVLDVGCGTGILSLFAAQAGASRVIAVEASENMSRIAKQIVKDNGFCSGESQDGNSRKSSVIEVVHGMVENLDKLRVPRHSVDVLVSEWMGYCLLFETMLNSVLYARDHWLKPGGAILPDTATIFVAGFGKGGTSIPFWENVYGFDMSCISKEVQDDAARFPIVDVVDSNDILTDAVILHTFDLATMKPEEVDFTATFDLEPKSDLPGNSACSESGATWCYGIVLWFETGFTSRFCKEMPAVLSTSPYIQKTHWSQTILTFHEPIALASSNHLIDDSAAVGTEKCPASRIASRVSIVRASVHRSIDISLEVTGISMDGQKRGFPIQIFNL